MIYKHPLGVTPSVEITIGGVEVNYNSIDTVTVSLNESEHDMVILRMLGIPAKAIIEYIGASVKIAFTRGSSETQVFVGEVVEVIPTSDMRKGAVNLSPFQVADIYCFGASYKMRGDKSRVWGEKTLTDIATELATIHGFSLDVPATTLIHTDTAQINTSDWAFLNDMCDSYGFALTVHGTHMHIWDPYKATGRRTSYHRLTSMRESGFTPNPTPGVISKFSGTFSADQAVERYTTVLDTHGNITEIASEDILDSSNLGKKFTTKYRTRIDATAKSVEEAELAVKANMRTVAPFSATVETIGLLGVYPGGIVKIDKYDSLFDGYWYVHKVRQVLSGAGLSTTLEILSDSTIEEEPTITNTARFTTPAEPVYKNNEWVSKLRTINVYQ